MNHWRLSVGFVYNSYKTDQMELQNSVIAKLRPHKDEKWLPFNKIVLLQFFPVI